MSTAQGFYEVYKALPKKVQQEVRRLIESENVDKTPLMTQIEEGLKEVKAMHEGNKPKKNIRDLINKMRSE